MKLSGMNIIQSTSSLKSITEKKNKDDKPVKQTTSKKNIPQKSLLNTTSKKMFARSVKTISEKKSRLKHKIFVTKNLLTDNSNPTQAEHNTISFEPKTKTDSKTISSKLLMHWTGKTADHQQFPTKK